MKYTVTDDCRAKLLYYFWDVDLKPLPPPNTEGKNVGKSTLKADEFPHRRIEAGELVDRLLFQ